MIGTTDQQVAQVGRTRQFDTLRRLLAIGATDLGTALNQASQLVAEVLSADKVDVFLLDASGTELTALGVSDTPMGRLERQIGLDHLALADGGRAVDVFQTGAPYRHGHADQDPVELEGVTRELGIRSVMSVPLSIGGTRRGVLQADSAQPEHFSEEDLHFFTAVADWVGMVAHRAELAERHAQDAAEQARRVTAQELVTVLAHDLNNHLTPLQARLDLIRLRAGREGVTSYVQDVAEAINALGRLRRLIADLLDVGRLDQGILRLSLRPVDLAALARQSADLLRTSSVDVVVEAPDELVLQADPDRLQQVLENLLTNAIKHSPEGVPVIVQLERVTRDDGEWAILRVRDRGPGIAPEVLPRLFTRFGAGPGSTGLGLGLFLARGIAEAHRGTLTAQSTPGDGASFVLSLPIAQARESEPVG